MNNIDTNLNSFTIKDAFYFLKRHYIKFLIITSLFFMLGCYYVLKTKPVFESTASILIDTENRKSFDFLDGMQSFYSKSDIIKDKTQILMSRNISEATIRKLIDSPYRNELYILGTREYTPDGYIRKAYQSITSFNKKELDSKNEIKFSDESIINRANILRTDLKIDNIRETNIFNISYQSLDPNESALVVNTFIQAYINKEIEWANKEVSQQIVFLQDQVAKKKIELEKIENKIKLFQEKENIYNVDSNTELLLNQFLLLENEVVKNKLLLEDVLNRKNIYKGEIKKEGISKTYELALKDSIRSVEILNKVYLDKIEKTNKELSNYQKSLDKLPRKMVDFFRLERSRNIEEQTYLLMMRKIDESKIIAESQIGSAKILDSALANKDRIKPNISKDLFLAIILGLIASIGICALIDFFDQSIKTVDDLEKFGLSVLSIIPSIKNSKKSFIKRKYRYKKNQNIERRLILAEDPKSPTSEAYRTLRTSISYSGTKNIKTIMVSSPGPGEGKTTTVANMAITYANLGKKTILIDTDLRKPVLHKVFNLKKEQGLTNYIIGDKNIETIINKTEVSNLDLITSGTVPPNPSELLDSDKMKEAIDLLKTKYDVILFDTPPIVAVTDAIILSKNIDKFILVCRSQVTQKGALDRVIKNIEQVDSKLDGCVLNALQNVHSYGSGYYYNYYQYYYGNEK